MFDPWALSLRHAKALGFRRFLGGMGPSFLSSGLRETARTSLRVMLSQYPLSIP